MVRQGAWPRRGPGLRTIVGKTILPEIRARAAHGRLRPRRQAYDVATVREQHRQLGVIMAEQPFPAPDFQAPAPDFRAQRVAELALAVGAELSEALGDVAYALQVQPVRQFLYISESVLQLTGVAADEYYADPSVAVANVDERDRHLIQSAFAAPPGTVSQFVVRWTGPDGRLIWTQHRCRTQYLDDGSTVVVAAARDVTAQVEAENALTESEERYRLLAENASDLVWRTNPNAVVEWVSPSVSKVLGWEPREMVGFAITDFAHPDDLDRMRLAAETASLDGRVSFEARYRCADGTFRWLEVTARPITDSEGRVVGRVGSCRDVNSEIEAWQAMERSENRLRLAMESAPTGMALTDLDRRFVEVNPALCRMLTVSQADLIGRRMVEIMNAADDDIDLRMRGELLSGAVESVTREVRLVSSTGSLVWVQHAIGLLRDENDVPQSYVSQFVNVTEAREAREALHFMATHDPLTQLLNRRELNARMGKVLSHAPRAGMRLAALYADLDGLKEVNDTFGHAAGDELIIETARRLENAVRDDDIAARVGGDEFVIVLPEVRGLEDAMSVASKVRECLADPMVIDGYPVPLAISIGIAIAEPGDDPVAVIRNADSALYRAKRAGRNRIEFHRPDDAP
jgi:diguanylate cyclase (GGDEF)-like protein/PAS domain S-box-containing protein